jgi:hypothetical protein
MILYFYLLQGAEGKLGYSKINHGAPGRALAIIQQISSVFSSLSSTRLPLSQTFSRVGRSSWKEKTRLLSDS